MAVTAAAFTGAAGEGAVEVDHVQPVEAGVLPGAGLGGGIVA